MPNKGRLYRIYDPEKINSAAAMEVKSLLLELAKPQGASDAERLGHLLGHHDMRVRLEAQYAGWRRWVGAVSPVIEQAWPATYQLVACAHSRALGRRTNVSKLAHC